MDGSPRKSVRTDMLSEQTFMRVQAGIPRSKLGPQCIVFTILANHKRFYNWIEGLAPHVFRRVRLLGLVGTGEKRIRTDATAVLARTSTERTEPRPAGPPGTISFLHKLRGVVSNARWMAHPERAMR